MKRVAIVLALVSACVTTSQVGPYVKNVYRQGDMLILQKCVIQLEGEELHEVNCTAEQLPLRSIQQMPPMMPGQQPPMMPPQQPPMMPQQPHP